MRFSVSESFGILCLQAIPYGLCAGATIGPYIMSFVLTGGGHWSFGCRCVGFLQIGLSAALLMSLPLGKTGKAPRQKQRKPIPRPFLRR